MTKEKSVTLRLTSLEDLDLKAVASVSGTAAGTLAGNWVREGVRRARFPAIEFRDGLPGRVAYLTGTRWPVWMIVQLVEECKGDIAAAAKHLPRPEALLKMALAYAGAYPEEIQACRDFSQRDFEDWRKEIPHLEQV